MTPIRAGLVCHKDQIIEKLASISAVHVESTTKSRICLSIKEIASYFCFYKEFRKNTIGKYNLEAYLLSFLT